MVKFFVHKFCCFWKLNFLLFLFPKKISSSRDHFPPHSISKLPSRAILRTQLFFIIEQHDLLSNLHYLYYSRCNPQPVRRNVNVNKTALFAIPTPLMRDHQSRKSMQFCSYLDRSEPRQINAIGCTYTF